MFHIGYAAIDNVYTIVERRSKLVRNKVFDCQVSPEWRQMTIECTVLCRLSTMRLVGLRPVIVAFPDHTH